MRVLPKPSLADRTSLRLGGEALAEVCLEEERDWENLPHVLSRLGGAPLILGRGSNVLAGDGELPLVLLRLQGQKGGYLSRGRERVSVQAQAGRSLPGLLAFLQRQSLSGLEGLTGIPGSVGGAVAMNAGSFGCSLDEYLERVQLWTQEDGLFWRDAADLKTGYRFFDPGLGSRFWVVAKAEFGLSQEEDPQSIKEKMRLVYLRKKRTQPILSRTCGCVFKNPGPESPAGRLLDDCGLKGFRCGGMGFSETHANFLVNRGRGRTGEALELIEIARERCKSRFGLELELEVRVIGG
ncbi:MAG: UDP-N-acetylmuramate dehydrogenase [Desulfohalobiaceae bacterium]|nr:UDP-N-acetylmuramate dehydrogenase [Desulfohalobiaceae bacterium]